MKAEQFLDVMGYKRRKARGKDEWRYTKTLSSECGGAQVIIGHMPKREWGWEWEARGYASGGNLALYASTVTFPRLVATVYESMVEMKFERNQRLGTDLNMMYDEIKSLLICSIRIE